MKRTTVELNEEISKNLFFLVLQMGTFEHKSFHMAGHLISNLVPKAGNLTNSYFNSSNAQGWPGGDLKFRIDRYITINLKFENPKYWS